VSSGRLVEPEPLHPGNVIRTTASAAYLAGSHSNMLRETHASRPASFRLFVQLRHQLPA